MAGPEIARDVGIRALQPLGIYLPGDASYPGGALFDPLGLAGEAGAFEGRRVAEAKHGRLAMVAWVGLAAQAAATGEGPVEDVYRAVGPAWSG